MPVTSQPESVRPLTTSPFDEYSDEKHPHVHNHIDSRSRRCHELRTRRILYAALLFLLALGLFALAALAIEFSVSSSGLFGLGDEDGPVGWVGGLMKRQSDGTVNNGNSNTFVNNKRASLFLILFCSCGLES